jgi:small GTP-binding protein
MNVTINYDHMVKILILGDTSVGKSNLMLRYTEDDFLENHITTIGFDFKTKVVNFEDQKQSKYVKLQIWDTSGQERYMAITKNIYAKVQGIILVFDITEINTFNNIEKWLNTLKDNGEFPVVLVGNKIDLKNRVVSYEEGKNLADEHKLCYFETSARDNINVAEPFEYITKIIIKNHNTSVKSSVKLQKTDRIDKDKKKGCC